MGKPVTHAVNTVSAPRFLQLDHRHPHDGSPGRYGRRSTGRHRYRGAVRQKTGEN
ncbi:hypothetical protein X942_5944 [Burkholderia pseudomallei MSHR5596]|nr:hypothetical protein X942_5944 [Burkholderia pseudomallei MSHR5596]